MFSITRRQRNLVRSGNIFRLRATVSYPMKWNRKGGPELMMWRMRWRQICAKFAIKCQSLSIEKSRRATTTGKGQHQAARQASGFPAYVSLQASCPAVTCHYPKGEWKIFFYLSLSLASSSIHTQRETLPWWCLRTHRTAWQPKWEHLS